MNFSLIAIGMFAVILLILLATLVVTLFQSFAGTKPPRELRELGDTDGGMDWREGDVSGEAVGTWDGQAVLLNAIPVFEAKAAARTLEAAHIRCRLVLVKEDREFHRYGNGGMGTLMCVLVAPGDYEAAEKAIGRG